MPTHHQLGAILACYTILALHLGVAESSSSYYSRRNNKLPFATHSNFLRSNYFQTTAMDSSGSPSSSSSSSSRYPDVLCSNNATICSDPVKNPRGGTTCCFNKVCRNTQTDENNCGACNTACAYGLTCCDGQCLDLMTNSYHCGNCNTCCHNNVKCEFGICGYGSGYENSEESTNGTTTTPPEAQQKTRYPKQW